MTSPDTEITPVVDFEQMFAAQPVFDREKKRYAVELLHRSRSSVSTLQLGQADTSDELLQRHCQAIMAQAEQYRTAVFVAIRPGFLLSGRTLPLEPDTTILTLTGAVAATPEFLAALTRYKKAGFRFALANVAINDNNLALLQLADIIKLDLLSSNLADIERYKQQYGRPDLLWLAEKVETEEQFAACKALGCDYFQGYFLTAVLEVEGKKIEPSALKLAEIISCLFAQEPDINQLALLLKDEPSIVIGILKLANSPLYRKTRDVSSVKEMVTRLGLELVRKWVLMYAVLESTTPASAITVLARAYSAQRIAQHWQLDSAQCQHYFLAALISGSDMLFGIASAKFLPHLNINKNIADAIINNTGPLANALTIIRSIERGYALKQPASLAELPYLRYYTTELAQIQKRLAQAGC